MSAKHNNKDNVSTISVDRPDDLLGKLYDGLEREINRQ